MCLINFDRRSLIAEHELLEGQETKVPRVTLFISNVMTKCAGSLKHGSYLELPNATINITESVERTPVFEVLRFIGWHRHHSNVVHHVFVIHTVVKEFCFVMSVEQVHKFCLLPNSVGSQ